MNKLGFQKEFLLASEQNLFGLPSKPILRIRTDFFWVSESNIFGLPIDAFGSFERYPFLFLDRGFRTESYCDSEPKPGLSTEAIKRFCSEGKRNRFENLCRIVPFEIQKGSVRKTKRSSYENPKETRSAL